jgi:HK97 gp10 family phage protein
MRKAMQKGAQLTLNAAISLAPRGKTGALAGSITMSTRGDTVSVGPNTEPRSDPGDKRKMRNDSVGNFLEKGTVNHFTWTGQRVTAAEARRKKKNVISLGATQERMPPHRFMLPAFQVTAEPAAQVIVDSLKQDIENQP